MTLPWKDVEEVDLRVLGGKLFGEAVNDDTISCCRGEEAVVPVSFRFLHARIRLKIVRQI